MGLRIEAQLPELRQFLRLTEPTLILFGNWVISHSDSDQVKNYFWLDIWFSWRRWEMLTQYLSEYLKGRGST
jgi:hypothetical protein